jgi:hypothetical protein
LEESPSEGLSSAIAVETLVIAYEDVVVDRRCL